MNSTATKKVTINATDRQRPYRPRTVNGAVKRGWHFVKIARREDLSYFGILNVVDRITQGRCIHGYDLQGGGTFAFELAEDATRVNLRLNFFRN